MLIQTVATVSYLPFVAVMVNSVRAHHKGARFSVLVTDVRLDTLKKIKDRFAEDIEFLCCEDLGIDSLSEMRKYYNVLEFNSACKILAIDYQLNKRQQTECLFLDPDLYAYGNIEGVFSCCGRDILLTPHTVSSYPDDGEFPSDIELVIAGHINGGIVYFRKSDSSVTALAWLVERTRFHWFVAPQYGLYADQQWLSLLPYYFDQTTYICKDPALNIGYFNLHERHLSEDGTGAIKVNGRNALLFHFSGFAVPTLGRLTRHANRRFSVGTEEVLGSLILKYEAEFLKESERLKGLNGDFLFCGQSLAERMTIAARIGGISYVQPYPEEKVRGVFSLGFKKRFHCFLKERGDYGKES